MSDPKIIESNELVRKYDFSSVITDSDTAETCSIVKSIIDSGNYFTNSPPYQTKENVFARPEPVWLKYRMSFLFSVFMYLGKEVKVGNMMAWSYMTNLDTVEDPDRYWHNHWHPQNPNARMMSGIFYLHIPSDVLDRRTCGTEMAPHGVDQPGHYFVTPTDFAWTIYPSETWHRPGIVQSNQNRFIIAADVEYML